MLGAIILLAVACLSVKTAGPEITIAVILVAKEYYKAESKDLVSILLVTALLGLSLSVILDYLIVIS